jgi:hypothetical protein
VIRKNPGPTARYRAKRRRAEAPVAKKVREACVERDGVCRYWWDMFTSPFYEDVVDCEGPSQWAHMREASRAKTRGMKPDVRHSTQTSLMLCRVHHDRYDGRQTPSLRISALSVRGADGPLEFSR